MADSTWLCRFHAPWLSSNSSHIRYVKCQVLSFKHYNDILIKYSETLGGQKPNLAAWKRFVSLKFPKFEQKWWTWLLRAIWHIENQLVLKFPKFEQNGERDYYEPSNTLKINWFQNSQNLSKIVNVTITSHLTHWKSTGSKIPKIWAK